MRQLSGFLAAGFLALALSGCAYVEPMTKTIGFADFFAPLDAAADMANPSVGQASAGSALAGSSPASPLVSDPTESRAGKAMRPAEMPDSGGPLKGDTSAGKPVNLLAPPVGKATAGQATTGQATEGQATGGVGISPAPEMSAGETPHGGLAQGFKTLGPIVGLTVAGIGVGDMLALAEDTLQARGYEPRGIGAFVSEADRIHLNAAHPDELGVVLDIGREMRFANLEEARTAAQQLCELSGAALGFRPISFLEIRPDAEEICSFMAREAGGYHVSVERDDGYVVHERMAVDDATI